MASSTAGTCQYIRVGSVVTVSGNLALTATTQTVTTEVGISLPIASAFAAATDCAGVGGGEGDSTDAAVVVADATNDRASLRFVSTDTDARNWRFTFTYRII